MRPVVAGASLFSSSSDFSDLCWIQFPRRVAMVSVVVYVDLASTVDGAFSLMRVPVSLTEASGARTYFCSLAGQVTARVRYVNRAASEQPSRRDWSFPGHD